MPRLSFVVSAIVSFLRSAVSALVTFLVSCLEPAGKYRPEQHYMRGPGPKWREKHFLDRASAWRQVSPHSNRHAQ
jgi:hypothetical protein